MLETSDHGGRVGFWDRILRRASPSTIRTTVQHPYIIRAPRIAFANLLGEQARSLVEEDRVAFGGIFAKCAVVDKTVPSCDVLVLYCHIESSGQIASAHSSLREIIRASGAVVVVVATENSPESYIASARRAGDDTANLVMTINRNGPVFSRFFQQLFARMATGITMPMAWVDLAPQIPGRANDDAPETIFACEAGHVTFAPRNS